MFHGVCKSGRCLGPGHYVDCAVDTTDGPGFVAHMRDVHKRRPITPDPIIKRTRDGWRTPKPKPFDPDPFGVGTWVTWHDREGEHTGQVWALGYRDTRWVADGQTYHAVYVSQLTENNERSAA